MISISKRGENITPIGKTSAESFHEPPEEEEVPIIFYFLGVSLDRYLITQSNFFHNQKKVVNIYHNGIFILSLCLSFFNCILYGERY